MTTTTYGSVTRQSVGVNHRIDDARQFAIESARIADMARAKEIKVLDLSDIHPEYDFFVIATVNSMRQMGAIDQDLRETLRAQGRKVLATEGENTEWMVIDLGECLVHLFTKDARETYDLEHLWADANQVEWNN